MISSSNRDSFTSLWPKCLVFLFLALLYKLGLPVRCWMGAVKAGILSFLPVVTGNNSAFHCWVCVWYVPFNSMRIFLFVESFYYEWVFNSVKCSSATVEVIVRANEIDFQMLNQPCIPETNHIYSWCVIFLFIVGFNLLLFC